ncbi:hypothetical protein BDP81DRAFT_475809 [Colletotrichum phormii]|uniref:Uncharacterized protein n=1 Tax=Colletotrichum phormii TaxID=359342 RepID=A0AAI9ZEW0_9PEZI|nr:uncharacterized protein BDP81DRAFT_475809 [Colletotrichum phormii]KAK1623273.1 hypothetical protein BDP81DRAFT_475809 [Colletotrichum phormii]
MPVIQFRLSEIQGNVALLERQIENESRGRAAAIRRRDELKAEKEELITVLSMAREGVKVAKASREEAAETAAEIKNDIRELHGISDQTEKEQWIYLRLKKHAEEEKVLRAQAEAMFGSNWEEHVAAQM